MFASGFRKYSAEDVVNILLDKTKHQGYICQQQPLGVKESKVFIVDTSKMRNPDDLKADELGGWKNDGQHPRWVKVKQRNGNVSNIEFFWRKAYY